MDGIFEELTELSSCARTVRVVDRPSQLDFANIARLQQPVLITNAINDWPALHRWNFEYLSTKINSPVSVAVTPNGRADAIGALGDDNSRAFFLPFEQLMSFRDFQTALQASKHDDAAAVFYVQQQNSNFTVEQAYRELQSDLPMSLAAGPFKFAQGVFSKPDAINFWCGNERATTSLHKDNYDNLYAVLTGRKTFRLFPPSDVIQMPYSEFTIYKWEKRKENSGLLTARQTDFEAVLQEPRTTVPWIDLPSNCTLEPIDVNVEAGQVLFLPALWFHEVRQHCDDEGKCVAINAWYDMPPGCQFSFQHFAQRVAQRFRFDTAK